ncbi:glycosyltransferase family 2 protein [Paludibaculum fermentans]|uniref:Glycosyltransferase family 2 protein n=1 Tax=Paludibaculum fermentans TaxID=1473598 RepID=A0A7S7NK89_PALFE|nr:glycosyltransferase family 2 protein [Paludibaculum fermentans]QOY85099.1 glycosyltransferase family 2 protein [Paludibaculum fermentans]
MLVSICIPTLCSSEIRLEKLAESIRCSLDQTHTDIEVLVVDNASAIPLEERLRPRFDDPRLKFKRNAERVSMPMNFNKALEWASGDIIKPLCDDDLMHPGLVAGCIPALERHPFLRIRDKAFVETSELQWSGRYTANADRELTWRQKYDIVDAIAPTCTMFTRRVWATVGPYNANVNYIWDYMFAMDAQMRFGFTLLPDVGCAFRVWPESSTAANTDGLRNYREMHLLFGRYKSLSIQTAKYLYLLRMLRRTAKDRSVFKETLRLLPNYL